MLVGGVSESRALIGCSAQRGQRSIAPQPVTVYEGKVCPIYTGEPLAQGALPEPEAVRLGSPLSGKGCEPSRGDSPVSNSTLTFWCLFFSVVVVFLWLFFASVLLGCFFCLVLVVFRSV